MSLVQNPYLICSTQSPASRPSTSCPTPSWCTRSPWTRTSARWRSVKSRESSPFYDCMISVSIRQRERHLSKLGNFKRFVHIKCIKNILFVFFENIIMLMFQLIFFRLLQKKIKKLNIQHADYQTWYAVNDHKYEETIQARAGLEDQTTINMRRVGGRSWEGIMWFVSELRSK